ncbi:AAA family ATPase [Methanogenium sp. S4BF]|uniref:AAA family ATPase n=1 Tax=Methanogenium sp. S4BF TaxID=1789226 RepID=UPI0024163A5D|nr:AAA family ATPase [Methanogenium sp. S4BF]WFN33473.1 AAA family ATPase [Methanogenium sp. S4BF]
MIGNKNLEKIIPIYIERFKQRYDELEEEAGRDGKKGSEIQEWLKREIQSVFSKENIDSPDTERAIKILSELFATEDGGDDANRDSPINIKLAEKLYSQKFIDTLKDLLFGNNDISVRYQRFMRENDVTRSITSELLTYFYPDKYAISNLFSERALAFLGFDYEEVPDKGEQIGDTYGEFCKKAAQVLKQLRKDSDFKDADFVTLDDFLCDISWVNIWKVAPGENAYLWDNKFWQDNEIVSINWGGLYENLKKELFTADKETIKKAADGSDYTANQHIKFLYEFKLGDIIVANRGKNSFIGYGVVKSDPKYRKDDDDNCYLCRDVLWQETDLNISIPNDSGLIGKCNQTIASLSFDQFTKYILERISERKYWVMNPSFCNPKTKIITGLCFWNRWRDENYIHLDSWKVFVEKYGADALTFSDPAEFKTHYNNAYNDKSHSGSLYKYLFSLKKGDIVLINEGKTRIVGKGVLSSETYYDDEPQKSYYHDVDWEETNLNIPIPKDMKGKFSQRVTELTKDEYERIMNRMTPKPIIDTGMLDQLLERKKQVILYGPPGTGKTFLATKYISSSGITGYNFHNQNLSDKKFYSITIYEPHDGEVKSLKMGDTFRYEWSKRFGKSDANPNWQEYYDEIQEGDFGFAYTAEKAKRYTTVVKCIQKNVDFLIFEVITQFNGPTYAQIKNSDLPKNNPRINFGKMSFSILGLSNNDVNEIISLSDGISPESLGITVQQNTEFVKNTRFVTFHPSFAYEDFIEGLRPEADDEGCIHYQVEDGVFKEFARQAFNVLLQTAGIEKKWVKGKNIPELTEEECDSALESVSEAPFYLIIDEINRGDISRIFGELITLLEADKRLCAENGLPITLPYSKTRFGIPPNLYIIGTMNTADKSIALVDIALRRRFGFFEMMPDSDVLRELLVSNDAKVQEIFDIAIAVHEQLNNAILEKYDRDHQIGHSYFVKLKDERTPDDACGSLEFIWYYEVLPLLQEYFYDSPKKLSEILGKDFVTLRSDDRSFMFTEPCHNGVFLSALKRLTKMDHSSGQDEDETEDDDYISRDD